MEQYAPINLEEYAGYKFFVEHVSSYTTGTWFRVHMNNGVIHNWTIDHAEYKDNAQQEVIKSFKEYLDGRN